MSSSSMLESLQRATRHVSDSRESLWKASRDMGEVSWRLDHECKALFVRVDEMLAQLAKIKATLEEAGL